MKHHTLLLIAGAVGVLYLVGKTQGAAAAGLPAGALNPNGFPGAGGYYGGGGYGPGYGGYYGGGGYGGGTPSLGTEVGGFVNSIFNQFGNNGGGTPDGGLGSVNPALYGSPTNF